MKLYELKADVNFLVGSTSGTYQDSDKLRNFNIAYQDVAREIWENAAGWGYDDSNNTTQAIAKTTLVHTVQDITLPVTIQRIHRVEVRDNSGIWHQLKQVDIHTIVDQAMPEFQKTPGLPMYYDLNGTTTTLYPAPHSASVTLASGIAFYVDRDVTELTNVSSATPGFPSAFHRILSYAAAIDFTQDPQQRQSLVAQKTRMEQGLSRFYAKRNIEGKKAITPAAKRNWRKYI